MEQKYRVECNYGSRYFSCAAKAFAYYKQKKSLNMDVEIWLVTYIRNDSGYAATQELLDYSSSNMPKC